MHEAHAPSLFERLTNINTVAVGAGYVSLNRERDYRASVVRNITWLLGSISLEDEVDFRGAEEAKRSLLNFGIRPFMGDTLTPSKIDAVCCEIKNKILLFEPRIKSESLVVVIKEDEEVINQFRLFSLSVKAEILNYPRNIDFIFKTNLNFDDCKIYIPIE